MAVETNRRLGQTIPSCSSPAHHPFSVVGRRRYENSSECHRNCCVGNKEEGGTADMSFDSCLAPPLPRPGLTLKANAVVPAVQVSPCLGDPLLAKLGMSPTTSLALSARFVRSDMARLFFLSVTYFVRNVPQLSHSERAPRPGGSNSLASHPPALIMLGPWSWTRQALATCELFR